jgi:hypothetical protein
VAAPRTLGLGLALLGLVACDRQAPRHADAEGCPPCECKECPPGQGTADGPEGQAEAGEASTATPGELSDIVASANRKMMHGDGPGCLAELERAKAIDEKLADHFTVIRAQCMMLDGKCQEGKQLIVDWYMREQAFTRGLAEKTAESIASMRCRGGDSTPRDRLLAALFDLSDGAYMNERDVDFCRDRVATIEKLAPQVQPRDAEDTQITGGLQALFHTSAMCFARAGDCATAYAYYRRLFPGESLDAIKDPKLRESTIRDAFDSTIALCKSGQP